MAKFIISEMNQARAEIKSWAQENIDTLGKKASSLGKMVQDDYNSGVRIDSIKDYASYNSNGINALINGVELFDTRFENAISAYNDDIGQDFDEEKINQKIEENNQLIYRISSQINSLPKDDITTSTYKFALNGNKGLLESINTTYSNLIEKFNYWNGKHSNDLAEAREIVNKANSILVKLENLSFSEEKGYNFGNINTSEFAQLEYDSWKKLLMAKEYINSKGEIQDKGYEFLENTFKKDINRLDSNEFNLASRLVAEVNTDEELNKVISLGYCIDKYDKEHGLHYSTSSKTYKTIIAGASLVIIDNYKDGNYGYNKYEKLIAYNNIMLDVSLNVEKVDKRIDFVDNEYGNQIKVKETKIGYSFDFENILTGDYSGGIYSTDIYYEHYSAKMEPCGTDSDNISDKFEDEYVDNEKNNVYNSLLKDVVYAIPALNLLSYSPKAQTIFNDLRKFNKGVDSLDKLNRDSEQKGTFSKYGVKYNSDSVDSISKIREMFEIGNYSKVADKHGLNANIDTENGYIFLSPGDETITNMNGVNNKIKELKEWYNGLTDDKKADVYRYYDGENSYLRDVLFTNGKGSDLNLEYINYHDYSIDPEKVLHTNEITNKVKEIKKDIK